MLTLIDTCDLTRTVFEDLMDDRCAIIWCRGFIEPEEADRIASQLLERCQVTAYQNIDVAVGRIGQSLFETIGADGRTDQRALDTYFAGIAAKTEEIENACAPFEVPIERFYRLINDLFTAKPADYDGRELFSGIARIIPSGEDVVPHNDSFSRDVPDLALAKEVTGQFAANIYLRLPDQGGELQLWDLRPTDQQLLALPPSKVGYGNDREHFRPPDLHIRPGVGDLVCFKGNILHAINRVGPGTRLNMNCFVARRADGSLIYWS